MSRQTHITSHRPDDPFYEFGELPLNAILAASIGIILGCGWWVGKRMLRD